MAKVKKTLDDASLRAMATLATSSSDLSKLQENYGWNDTDKAQTDQRPEEPTRTDVANKEEQLPQEIISESKPVEPAEEKQESIQAEVPVKGGKEPVSAGSGKKVDKYTNTFLQPIKGFERPTKVAYISKRTHSYIALLQRYADMTGSKVSMQEIMENIFRQHIAEHKVEIELMRTTLQQKEAELHE